MTRQRYTMNKDTLLDLIGPALTVSQSLTGFNQNKKMGVTAP